MADSVSFPLFVFEKDDCSMFLVEGPDKVLYQMEPIDIENGEYLFWDASGKCVQISLAGKRVTGIDYAAAEMSLPDAFKRHSDALGLRVETTGPADKVWHRLKEAEAQLPRNSGFMSRVFGRKQS
jgi:hypothetical protein